MCVITRYESDSPLKPIRVLVIPPTSRWSSHSWSTRWAPRVTLLLTEHVAIVMRAVLLSCLAGIALAEQPCEDSPALTTIWESTSTGNSDRLIDTLIQNHDFATHRSNDCRGPLFWAFEFKNVDALALYMHLEADLEQTDQTGKNPKHMFDGSEEDMQGAPPTLAPSASLAPMPRSSPPSSREPVPWQSSLARPSPRSRSSPRCWPRGRRSSTPLRTTCAPQPTCPS